MVEKLIARVALRQKLLGDIRPRLFWVGLDEFSVLGLSVFARVSSEELSEEWSLFDMAPPLRMLYIVAEESH